MKKYFGLVIAFTIGIFLTLPSSAFELEKVMQDIDSSIKPKKLSLPCDIYRIIKDKDMELMDICFHIPAQQERLAAYYLLRYEVMHNIIVDKEFKKDAEQALSFLINNADWNPNLMINANGAEQKIYLIGKENQFWQIPNDATVIQKAIRYNNMPLMLLAALADNATALNLIYQYNAKNKGIEYSNYVVMFSIFSFVNHYDVSKHYKTFKMLYNFAKSKEVISTDVTDPNVIKLISEMLRPENRGVKNLGINLILDDYKNGNEINLVKDLIKHTKSGFDFSYFFENIIKLNGFSVDEKIDILNYTIANRSYDLKTVNTILKFLTADDIKNNFNARILFNLPETLLIQYLNNFFIKFVNNQANNLRVKNDNMQYDRNSISLFAYWVLTYSRSEQPQYLKAAKILLDNGASVAEKVNGKTLRDFILEQESENLIRELNL